MSAMKSAAVRSTRGSSQDVYGHSRADRERANRPGHASGRNRARSPDGGEPNAGSRGVPATGTRGVGSGGRHWRKTKIAAAPATVADLIDLFGIIGALEGVAGRGVTNLAARDRRALAGITALNARFAQLSTHRLRDPEGFFESHDAFHATLVERCASDRLRRLIEAVRPQVRRYELLYATAVGPDFTASVREHRGIVSAVRSGTADNVERAVRLNWSNSAVRFSAGLPASYRHAENSRD